MIRQSNGLVFYTFRKTGAKSYLMTFANTIAVKWFCALKPYQFSKTSVFEASPMNPRIDFTVGNVSNFMPILATMFLALPL